MALSTFPTLPGFAWPVKRSPVWNTEPQDALSGKRIRIQRFSFPIYRYEVSFNVLRNAGAFTEWQQLQGFINSAQGSTLLWQYSDVDDSVVTAQQFGLGDGASKSFQLVRTLGGFTEPVFLVNGVPSISVAGVLKTVTTDYTISPYGVVTFTTAPANGAALTWTGSFYWPCRFDDDATEFVAFMSGFRSLSTLRFSTEKLP